MERELAHNGIQSCHIFAFGEGEHVVLAESPAINGKTEPVPAEILIEFDCLVFRHGDEHLIAILRHGTKHGLHGHSGSKVLTKLHGKNVYSGAI